MINPNASIPVPTKCYPCGTGKPAASEAPAAPSAKDQQFSGELSRWQEARGTSFINREGEWTTPAQINREGEWVSDSHITREGEWS